MRVRGESPKARWVELGGVGQPGTRIYAESLVYLFLFFPYFPGSFCRSRVLILASMDPCRKSSVDAVQQTLFLTCFRWCYFFFGSLCVFSGCLRSKRTKRRETRWVKLRAEASVRLIQKTITSLNIALNVRHIILYIECFENLY